MKRILEMPETVTKLTDIGAVPSPMTPDQFTAFIARERAKWAEVGREGELMCRQCST